MGFTRKVLSVSTLGLVDFRSDKERIARYTKKTMKTTAQMLDEQRLANARASAAPPFTVVAPVQVGPAVPPVAAGGPEVLTPFHIPPDPARAALPPAAAGPPPPPLPAPPGAHVVPLAPPPDLAPGWHPDPVGRAQARYWSGTAWTEHVATDGRLHVDPLG